MKTSKETQLEILDKMKSNIENDLNILQDIEYYSHHFNEWRGVSDITRRGFDNGSYRVKPTTITVNGVEIPKPLDREDLIDSNDYFYVCADKYLYDSNSGEYIKDYDVIFVYETKEEAIKASKLLFGLGD